MSELRSLLEVAIGLLMAAYGWILRDAHARLQRLEREAVREHDHQAGRKQLDDSLRELKGAVEAGFKAQREADEKLGDEMVRLHERYNDRLSRVVGEIHTKIDANIGKLRDEFRASLQRPP